MAGKRALAFKFSAAVIVAVLQLLPTWGLCLMTWTQRPASPSAQQGDKGKFGHVRMGVSDFEGYQWGPHGEGI